MPNDPYDEYEQLCRPLPDLGRAVLYIIDQVLAKSCVPQSVDFRVKERSSAIRKLTKYNGERSLSELTDLLGVRIITHFKDEVDAVAGVIREEFEIDEANSSDKRAEMDPDRFGYMSLHYIAQLDRNRIRNHAYHQYEGIKFEIQIRSILQHAWADIEHDLGYKTKTEVPLQDRRRFSQLAGLLEVADDLFVQIRDNLEGHQEDTDKAIKLGQKDLALDQNSLYSYVDKSGRLRTIDQYAAKQTGRNLTGLDRNYIGRRVTELAALGIELIADIDRLLAAETTLLKVFIDRLIDVPASAPRSAEMKPPRPDLPCGVTLFFLYLLLAAGAQARGDLPPRAIEELSPAAMDQLKNAFRSATKELGRDPESVTVKTASTPE